MENIRPSGPIGSLGIDIDEPRHSIHRGLREIVCCLYKIRHIIWSLQHDIGYNIISINNIAKPEYAAKSIYMRMTYNPSSITRCMKCEKGDVRA